MHTVIVIIIGDPKNKLIINSMPIHSFFIRKILLYVILLILKLKLKANINLAFKNSEKHRQANTLHCITPSLEITCTCTFV